MATRLLDPSGVDSGTGLVSPWQTLEYAIDNMSAGDTVEMADGTYVGGRTVFNGVKSGVGSDPDTQYTMFKAATIPSWSMTTAPTYGVIIQNASSSEDVIGLPDTRQYIGFRGIKIDGQGTSGYGVKGCLNTASAATQGQNLLFEDVLVTRTPYGLSGFKPHFSNSIVRRFHLTDIAGGALANYAGGVGHGVYQGAFDSDNLWEYFNINDVSNVGYRNEASGGGAALRNILRYGIIKGCHQGLYLRNTCTTYYVTVSTTGSAGVLMRATSGNIVSAYNLSVYNTGVDPASSAAGLLITNDAGTLNLRNCISLGNDGANLTGAHTGAGTTSHNITSGTFSNFWTDAANDDFSLKVTATTAIDSGVSVGLTEDRDGTSVPQGAAVDIGAIEYGSDPPDGPAASHDVSYTVSTVYGDVAVTLVKGTNNIVECTLSGTGAAALCVDNTNVTVTRVT